MITIQDVYKGLVGVKKKNGLCQVYRINCENGLIENYKSELSDADVNQLIDGENLEKVPYYILKQEAMQLQIYLRR